jgi:hypothetical protein
MLFKTATVLSVIALFAACKKKEDNNTNQLSSLTTATINGKVFATTVDTPGAAAVQYAPVGTVVNAWVDTKDFVVYTDPSAPYAKKYYTTTVDASGSYKLTVDVSKYKPATIHIVPTYIEAQILMNTHGVTHPDSIFYVRQILAPSNTDIPVVVSDSLVMPVDIHYLP